MQLFIRVLSSLSMKPPRLIFTRSKDAVLDGVYFLHKLVHASIGHGVTPRCTIYMTRNCLDTTDQACMIAIHACAANVVRHVLVNITLPWSRESPIRTKGAVRPGQFSIKGIYGLGYAIMIGMYTLAFSCETV